LSDQLLTAANTPQTYVPATRIQQSILAQPEKRLLVWLAARTPAWISSDHLTALGLLSMFAAGGAYAYSSSSPGALWLASLFIALNWLGDSLDGTLARFRDRQRPRYGFYVDHVVDAIGTLALFIGMAAGAIISWEVAAAVTLAYFLLFIEVGLACHALGEFRISAGIFGPTELRLLLIAGNIRAFFSPDVHVLGEAILLYNIGGVCAVLGMLSIFVMRMVKHTKTLFRQEAIR
jgi:archaetidylinositol phosphate synthase